MVKINGKFMRAEKLGEKLAEGMCKGWNVTTEITDIFGNGYFVFEKRFETTRVVPFTEINVNDTVTIEWFKLGNLKRLYK